MEGEASPDVIWPVQHAKVSSTVVGITWDERRAVYGERVQRRILVRIAPFSDLEQKRADALNKLGNPRRIAESSITDDARPHVCVGEVIASWPTHHPMVCQQGVQKRLRYLPHPSTIAWQVLMESSVAASWRVIIRWQRFLQARRTSERFGARPPRVTSALRPERTTLGPGASAAVAPATPYCSQQALRQLRCIERPG